MQEGLICVILILVSLKQIGINSAFLGKVMTLEIYQYSYTLNVVFLTEVFKCFYSKNLRVDTSVLVGGDGGNFGVKTEENIW